LFEILSPLPSFHYLVRLAAGSSATLWLVASVHEAPAELWVVKELHTHLHDDASARAIFLAEAQTTSRIEHPHKVAARGFDDAQHRLGLNYVEGVSLAYLLDAAQSTGVVLPNDVMVRVVLDVLDALSWVHGGGPNVSGLVHGDINPRNILVDRHGRGWVCDFGSAAPPGRQVAFRGTFAYAAPETLTEPCLWPQSDVFSCGVMLWEALRGQRLFRRQGDAATLLSVVDQTPAPVDEARPDLTPFTSLLHRALQKDPQQRITTAKMAADLLQTGALASRARVAEVVMHLAGNELTRRANVANSWRLPAQYAT